MGKASTQSAGPAVLGAQQLRRVSDESSMTQKMLSASAGSLVTSLTMNPFDVVKTRMQAQIAPPDPVCPGKTPKGELCSCKPQDLCTRFNGLTDYVARKAMPSENVKFNGTLDAFSKIVRNEGVVSLWRGLPPTLVMSVPQTVMYFTLYDESKRRLDGLCEGNSFACSIAPMVAGSAARSFTTTIVSPIELIRTRIQSSGNGHTSMIKALRDGVRSGGVMSLWKGLGPTLWRDVPFSALYWGGFETIKSFLDDGSREMTSFDTFKVAFVSGAGSGMFAAAVTTPFDVVKTKRQIEDIYWKEMGISSSAAGSTSTSSAIKTIFRDEGLSGLFAGLVPRLARVAPACAIMIGSYEFGKVYFTEL